MRPFQSWLRTSRSTPRAWYRRPISRVISTTRAARPARAFELYQRSRVARTARIVLSAREMGRIFHAKGVERLVRNDLWEGRSPERFYDAMEWLYSWRAETCLAD